VEAAVYDCLVSVDGPIIIASASLIEHVNKAMLTRQRSD